MSEPKFTPGPWEATVRHSEDMPDFWWVTAKRSEIVCRVRVEANANLIAAAPSLYEAAFNLRKAQRAYLADRGNEQLGRSVGEAAAELDDVLNKACGEQ
jgi:hypothetical protein